MTFAPEPTRDAGSLIGRASFIDMIGTRRDGGVDFYIYLPDPLDDSPATLEALRAKVVECLRLIESEDFCAPTGGGRPLLHHTSILIVTDDPITPPVMDILKECKAFTARRGVRLRPGISTFSASMRRSWQSDFRSRMQCMYLRPMMGRSGYFLAAMGWIGVVLWWISIFNNNLWLRSSGVILAAPAVLWMLGLWAFGLPMLVVERWRSRKAEATR